MRAPFSLLTPLALLLSTSCKFAELPPVEEDAGTDATGMDVPTGPAVVATDQGPHDFGEIVIATQSPLLRVTIRNDGGETTGPLAVALVGANVSEFAIVPTGDGADCVSARLAGGATCIAQVRYSPTVNAAATARLEVSGNPGGTATVSLLGDALTPANITSSQGAYDFGDLVMGQASTLLQVVVRNEGEEESGAISIALGGPHAGDFAIVPTGGASDCAGATLAFQETCIAQVRFQPTVAATRTAALTVTAAPGGTVMVALTGDGLSPGNLVVEMPAGGAPLDFGMRELNTGTSSATQTIRVRNSGGAATGTLDVTVTGGGASSFTIPIESCDGMTLGPNVTCDVQVRFSPMAVGQQPATVSIRDTVAMTAASVSASGVGTARVSVTKTGQGSITSNPNGISCGTGCSTQTQSFAQTPITVSATPETGWIFSGWSGSCSGSNPSPVCSLLLDQGLENVGALFTQVFVLSVSTTGSGTVTSSSPGILCGDSNTDCTETYPIGTMVQLNAEPAAGWEVYAWSGTGTSCGLGARACTVTMSQARNVTLEFRRTYTLSVSVSGSGQGTVSGTFTGGSISCSSGGMGTCAATVFDGTTVTLNQAAGSTGAGSQILFGGWGADCASAGSMTSCMLTINGSKSASASYTLQHRLSLTLTGAGAGMVTANPGNFVCSTGTCTRFYDAGTSLTITATPSSALDGFSAFTGDCTSNPCTIASLSAPASTTASFVRYVCAPSTEVCSGGQYTQCDATGSFVSHVVPNGAANGTSTTLTMNMYQCPMGCHASLPRCADVNASNGFNLLLDSAAVSPTGVDIALPRSTSVPPGLIVIDTSNFDSGAGTTTITDADGTPIVVPASIVAQGSAPEILVLKVRTFTVRSGFTVEVRGTRALGVASRFDIFLAGTLDLSGTIGSGTRVGPGQGNAPGCQGNVAGTMASTGGGGNSAYGGNGSDGAGGGVAFSDTTLVPLQGGCSEYLFSMGGGGAIQLVSKTRIALASTAVVDLSGAGGVAQVLGGGGSAGGSALLEAPTITLTSGSVIAGRGGSGAAYRYMMGATPGNEGPTSGTTGAAGVTCSGCGGTSGAGGTESSIGGGTGTATLPGGTGGGGAAGRCVTRNASGTLNPPAGTMKLRHLPHMTLPPRSP